MQKYRVIKYTFAPSEVGQERKLMILGVESNVPKSTPTTSSVVGKNLTKGAAERMRDRLNDKSLNSNVESFVGYRVAPQA